MTIARPFSLAAAITSLSRIEPPDWMIAVAPAAADGHVLIRVPTCSSLAWETYGVDWVQLDAPRHLLLFSRGSFRRLAGAHGLRVVRVEDDSDGFQF